MCLLYYIFLKNLLIPTHTNTHTLLLLVLLLLSIQSWWPHAVISVTFRIVVLSNAEFARLYFAHINSCPVAELRNAIVKAARESDSATNAGR